MRRRKNATVSRSSPKGGKRGCLCSDGRTYSSKCCDGTLEAQGIGNITKSTTTYYYNIQLCGHSQHKEIYIEDVELTIGNVYYFDFTYNGHSGCYTVIATKQSGEHKINSVTAYNDCDACTTAN